MIDYRSGLWNDWAGSDTSPVMDGDLVEFFTHVTLEENLEAKIMYGSALEFDWIGCRSDIVKFRVIKKAEEV